MADRKITDLTALAAGSQATGDLVTIVDVSESAAADKNKKMTMENLFKGIPGDVGIGTSAPSQKLHIFEATDGDVGIRIQNNDGFAELEVDADELNYNADSHVFNNQADSSEFMRINSSGRVGIGTTSPGRLLHLKAASSTAYSGGSDSADYNFLKIENTTDDKSAGVFFQIGGNGEAAITATEVADGNTDIAFQNRGGGVRSEKMRIDSSGNVGIGTSSPSETLTLNSSTGASIGFEYGGTEIATINNNNSALYVHAGSGKLLSLGSAGGEAARFDTSKRLLIGSSSSRANGYGDNASLQLEGTNYQNAAISAILNSGNANGPSLNFAKARGTSNGSSTIVQNNDNLGVINFAGGDGTDIKSAGARIRVQVDGTPGGNDMPGRITFETTADGSTSPIERIRIDSSGRLLVGTTTANGSMTVNMGTDKNISFSGGVSEVGSVPALQATNTSGSSLASMGFRATDLRFATGSAERMRIDSSGRLLIGTSSSEAFNGTPSALQIEGTSNATTRISLFRTQNDASASVLVFAKARNTSHALLSNNDEIGKIEFYGADGADTNQRAGMILCAVDGTPGSNDMPGRLVFSTTADGASSPTERMEISNQGRCDIFASGATDAHFISSAASAGTAVEFIKCMHSASSIGSGTTALVIHTNGNVENSNNSYGQISDVKLKENIVNANSQWDDIKDIQVRNFNFKQETGNPTHTQIGVVAQELETVSPGLVYETPDRDSDGTDLGTVTKSVNYSVLYMKAVKALQEAMDRIETLEAKVAALEAQ